MTRPKVSIIMGSDSDFTIMEESVKVLKEFGVPHEVMISSAHRSPERTAAFARSARASGIEAIIVGAGAAAHLAGVIAAHTTLPVIGVPIDATSLHGVDALYATVMMPGGIPVASMAIGKAGAKNAALFVVSMFSVREPDLATRLQSYRLDLERGVLVKSEALRKRLASA